MLPFLIAGFIMFLGFSSMQSVIGFAVQDRFGLDESATAGVTAALMVVMSVSMVVTQAGVVPRLRWEARRLLRIGLFLTTVGFRPVLAERLVRAFVRRLVSCGRGHGHGDAGL